MSINFRPFQDLYLPLKNKNAKLFQTFDTINNYLQQIINSINGGPSVVPGVWIQSPNDSDNIYYNAGDVGIGLTDPTEALTLGDEVPQSILFDAGVPARYRISQARALPNIWLASNAHWDGANWQRDDTSQGGHVITLRTTSIALYTFPSGNNPATITQELVIDISLGLITYYNSFSTSGLGVPGIYYSSGTVRQTTSTYGPNSMQVGGGTPPQGHYRITGYLQWDVNVTGIGSEDRAIQIQITDSIIGATNTTSTLISTSAYSAFIDYIVVLDGVHTPVWNIIDFTSGGTHAWLASVTMERLS